MKQFTSIAILCGLSLMPSLCFAQVVDEFTCGGSDGSTPIKMWIENGHLKAYTTKNVDYGEVKITPTHYRARLAQPLMTNGTGWAVATFTIERLSGRFEFEMNAQRPDISKPFHSLGVGVCTGVDIDDLALPTPSPSRANNTSGDNSPSDASPSEIDTPAPNADNERAQMEREQQTQRLEKERAAAAEKAKLEQQRKQEDARIAREKAEIERKKKEEDARIAKEKSQREAKEKAEQERRNNENGIRTSFSGWATTCAGGGKDVLYLQTSRPPTTGCTVNFQARCPNNTGSVDFTQRNYIGGSCMGLGDNIRIGTLPCDAKQVQVSVTSASCGM